MVDQLNLKQWKPEKIYSLGEDYQGQNPDGEAIAFVLSGGQIVYLRDQVLTVYDRNMSRSEADCYIIRKAVDWESLRACLRETDK